MSGHGRFCVAAFLFAFGALAFSNPLIASVPAPAQSECALQPGKSTTPGHRWVYHLEGHRKCWFQADRADRSMRRQVHHHEANQPVAAPEENEVALGEKTVRNARAQMLDPTPTDAPGSAPEAVASASVGASPAVTLALATPPAEVIAPHTIDHPKPGHDLPGPADAGVVSATHPLAGGAAASATSLATTRAVSTSMPTLAGVALIALGLILLVGSPLVTRWQSEGGTDSQA
jgi:hypothetical protein